MRTIALRYGEHFAPSCGTIAAHQRIIDELGYVWYGKLGTRVSDKMCGIIMSQESPKILLICSGKKDRYWAYIDQISNSRPGKGEFPDYYQDKAEQIRTWFRISLFEKASKDIMSVCTVSSSGNSLSETSKHSMSPYFIIEVH